MVKLTKDERKESVNLKNFRLIISRVLMLLLFLMLGQLIAHLAVFVTDAFYSAFHKWFGDAFPLYSPIGSGKEKYELFRTVINLVSYTASLYLVTFLSILLSNKPNELLISKTDGFFTLPEGFGIYVRSFAAADFTASLISSFVLLLPIAFIPDGFFTKDYSFFFTFQKTIYDTFGLVFGGFTSAFVIFTLHIIAIFPAMSRWRASWLTGFAR